jgi:FtsP/CotA-like multicopper oxidase with cupredoxin domain
MSRRLYFIRSKGADSITRATKMADKPVSVSPLFPLTRRRLLAGIGASVTAVALPKGSFGKDVAADGYRVLRVRAGTALLRGKDAEPTPIWGYDGMSPGPTLRVKQGDELKVRLVNEIKQATVVHWHGLRLPNAMDGVPHLTQAPIEPGQSFDYHFAPPDAGTFWYHTHFGSSEQLARGLYGVLIVAEREPVAVDRDIVLVLADWRLLDNGEIAPGFGNFHDAMMAGRLGQYITLNSQDTLDIPVKSNERLRLRIVNTANARIFQFRIAQHQARVMAVDGQPCPPEIAPNGRLRLAPGSRVDLFLDATLGPGSQAPILVDDLRGGELQIGRLVYDAGTPARETQLDEPKPLPDNPVSAKLDLANALKVDVPLDGGGMGMMMGGMMGGRGMGGMGMGSGRFNGYGIPPQARIWALAGISATGHDGPPLFRVARGRTVMLNFVNRTAFPHAMHVHGHHFRQLDAGGTGWRPYWLDTVIVDVERTERIAFIADNPGKWMIHCHMIEHMAAGMAAWFEVA